MGDNIEELSTKDSWERAFPIMYQLRPHLKLDTYIQLVQEAVELDRYKMYGLFEKEQLVSVVGFKPMTTLYYGRFVWVCDLVTKEEHRSKGYGERLLDYVHSWATERDYDHVALSSGLERYHAHRFYEHKMNYEKVSYVFKRSSSNHE
ncbi:GNAT family N-acetyltransferase [Salirhabdus salicampi]|uniref:GNAT family N-acetyltransferase n=1 Tax=Salirhabdus salicampi TaxID=476102 RepID=UPI0020C27FC8|nr:GNAT family N-acetyltransferase [Salirhabdus salicampi]MCP8615442.1 GNAT family N-acetyltransferase [Salirhabdus salicampi]